ncbi:aldose 1-epimerase [Neisseria yangbaofengii]|uniref:aldose 1-epimerase n=1 Tax=Neisseria yangbaofengii TaxID=2709396 RepID=UPI0013EA28E8|nr:aldose 1-epimerase [Neisseria yangbaofengii]
MFSLGLSEETVLIRHDRCRAEIYTFGALLNRYEIMQSDGTWFNAVNGHESPQQCRQALTDGFRSAKLSPFACRVRHGKYVFEGRHYQLDGKFQAADHALHGLMYDLDFTVVESGADAQSAWVELAADYRQDDSGYPFAYRLNIVYRLASDGLSVTTGATNTGNRAMPLADGWHPYFMLGGKVDDWTMQLNSSERLEFDQDLVANGNILPDTRFQTALSMQGITLDNSFVLADFDKPACVLSGENLQLRIYPDSGYPYLQIYIPPTRDSIALENLSGAPDCFNNGLGLQVLQAGETQTFSTRYVLSLQE